MTPLLIGPEWTSALSSASQIPSPNIYALEFRERAEYDFLWLALQACVSTGAV